MTRPHGNRESCTACDPNCPDCLLHLILLPGILIMAVVFPACPLAAQTKASVQKQATNQHFACNVGYTPQECQAASTVVSKVLGRYPVDALGDWTWVLVRNEDWKKILSERKVDPNVPAFTYLSKRETFLDGSLVAGASVHGAELCAIWHMSVEDLLDFAIRHELAHALCNERDESKVDRAAIDLKNGAPLSCRATPLNIAASATARKHQF